MPETYLEKKRREAQAFYVQEQQYLKDNKEEIERLMQADLDARTKEMGGTIFGMMAGMAPGPLTPQEEAVALAVQDGDQANKLQT
jgi:import inner membrane translocase subunit TIM50